MKCEKTSSWIQEQIAYILLISLFLQSCSNPINSPLPLINKEFNTQETIDETTLDQEHIVEGRYTITFYKDNNALLANVHSGDEKKYNGIPVEIEVGIDVARLSQLPKKIQQNRIHIQLAKSQQPDKVFICRATGLMGGSNKGKEKVTSDEEEEGEEVQQWGGWEEFDNPLLSSGEIIEDEEPDRGFSDLTEGDGVIDFPTELSNEMESEAVQQQVYEESLDSLKDQNLQASAIGLKKVTLPEAVQQKIYEAALDSLKNQNLQASAIDLRKVTLNKKQLEELEETINQNNIVGYIAWGEVPTDCKLLQQKIETKLVQNICSYSYHPSDYIHGLLARHVYTYSNVGDSIDLQTVSEALGHTLTDSTSRIWKVVEIQKDTTIAETGYYSALYVNEKTHQAVLAFQGTKMVATISNILNNRDLKEDLEGVLGNKITTQQSLASIATQDAVNYATRNALNLSLTGHSLGGYLAELGVFFFYRDFKHDFKHAKVKAVVFDSPGIGRKIKVFKPNVINPSTTVETNSLPILTYLSVPNIVNSCNIHLGEVYQVHPNLKWEGWMKKLEDWAKKMSKLEEKVASINKCLLALTGHSLDLILMEFDQSTGKPSDYTRIADWPRINLKATKYIGKKGLIAGGMVSKVFEKMGIPMGWFVGRQIGCLIDKKLDKQLCLISSLAGLVLDRNKIDLSQYWHTIGNLDKNYMKPVAQSPEAQFNLRYQGAYANSFLKQNEHVLNEKCIIDDFLHQLSQVKSLIQGAINNDKSDSEDFAVRVLQEISKNYAPQQIDNYSKKNIIKLKEQSGCIEALRYKMRRAIDVLTPQEIKKAIDRIKKKGKLAKGLSNSFNPSFIINAHKQNQKAENTDKSGIERVEETPSEEQQPDNSRVNDGQEKQNKCNLNKVISIFLCIFLIICVCVCPLYFFAVPVSQKNVTNTINNTCVVPTVNPLSHINIQQNFALPIGNGNNLELVKIQPKEEARVTENLQEKKVHKFRLTDGNIAEYIAAFKGLQGTQVHTLDLRFNSRFGLRSGAIAGLIELVKHLQAMQVHTLDLRGNHIGNAGTELVKHLQAMQVHTLDLRGNQIGNAGATELGKHLQAMQVHTLNLSGNLIDCSGVTELGKYLQGTNIHTLYLSANKIGNVGATELGKHLQRTNIQTLELFNNRIGDVGAAELVKNLQGTNVHTLVLGSNKIGDSGATGLGKHLQGTNIQTLELNSNRIGNAGAIGLAQGLQGTRVHTLDLTGNLIGGAGATEFSKHLQGTNVHTLVLNSNQIGNAGIAGLAQGLQGTNIHTLVLNHNKIGDAGATELSKHLQETNMHTLLLSENQIGDVGAIELTKNSQGTNIHTLNLRGNNLGDAGAIGLAQHLQETNIQTLDLTRNQIGDVGAIELAQHLQGTNIRTLNLGGNNIGDVGAIELVKHLKGVNIYTLNLGGNNIGDVGAIELAQHLQGTNIRTLNLGGNNIGDSGATALGKYLQETNIQTLNLQNNNIGKAGAIELGRQLKGTSIHTLDLSGNHIGDAGATALGKYLQETNIQTLNLRGNNIGKAGAIELSRQLKGTSIQTLDLSLNHIGDAGATALDKYLQGTNIQMLDLSQNQIKDAISKLLEEQNLDINFKF